MSRKTPTHSRISKWSLKLTAVAAVVMIYAGNVWSGVFPRLPLMKKPSTYNIGEISERKESGGPLFKRSAFGEPDTLEIFVMYAEFAEEIPEDNSNTTGDGKFNSAYDSTFKLDPVGFRNYRYYLDKHLEFANDYFTKISEGRIALKWRIFPQPDQDGRITNPYQLKNRMAAYNPSKRSEEKNIFFYERKAQALMSFVAETIRRANNEDNSANNPFMVPPSNSPHVYRCYLIFHAGHSGLIDGGKLGQLGADTPNDIVDFFATREDFFLLKDLQDPDENDPVSAQKGDSLGVAVFGGDTVSQVMVLSESASQDEVNFGINGILVNQIARQIGMPDTWDRGTGFTQLGYFDLMDVGHLSLFGFIPVYPSAWLRYYMGWEEPLTAYPAAGGAAEYELWSPLASGSGNTNSLIVPINEREYLMVENRQRSLHDSITVYFSEQESVSDNAFSLQDSITLPSAHVDSLLLDSLCDENGKNCAVNQRRPRGIITGVSSYDMGLPGSGLLVWHVNEWFIEEAVRYGFVNASVEETQEFLGINLVEADGDLSIGKEGKDQLNQSVFDFGSGSDMLPHIRKYVKEVSESDDTTWSRDTIRFISPYGHANTNAWNDGKSHIVLEAVLPDVADDRLLRGVNLISGDSVLTFPDSVLRLRVIWNSNPNIMRQAGWKWPVITAPGSSPQGLAFLDYAAGRFALALSDEGYLQAFDPQGNGAVSVFDTLLIAEPYDSLHTLLPAGKNRDSLVLPVFSLGDEMGRPLGSAVMHDTVSCVLTADGRLHLTALITDSLGGTNASSHLRFTVEAGGVLGPMVIGDEIWVVNGQNEAVAYSDSGGELQRVSLPSLQYHSMAAIHDNGSDRLVPVLSGAGAGVVMVDVANNSPKEVVRSGWSSSNEFFSVAGSDFDRDGESDILLMGSRGTSCIFRQDGNPFPNFPRVFRRATAFTSPEGEIDLVTEDRSSPALADLNEDGHPEIIFTGPNNVQAVNYHGAIMEGWPFTLERTQLVGQLYSSYAFPATVVQSTPLVAELNGETVVFIASPDGLIWAVDSRGDPLTTSSFSSSADEVRYGGIPSLNKTDWPLSVGGLNYDTTDVPFINISLFNIDGSEGLELFAQTGTGGVYAWSLPNARAKAGADWTAPDGNMQRHNYLDAGQLQEPVGLQEVKEIREFHFFPSPLTGPRAGIHLDIGAAADKARLRLYDLAGNVVKDQNYENPLLPGKQPEMSVDLSHLGPDVYSALMEVWFTDGSKKKKWERLGVIR
ncbi:FG-GAP-like repeat-containing protein [Fibrobacterota bacterium]